MSLYLIIYECKEIGKAQLSKCGLSNNSVIVVTLVYSIVLPKNLVYHITGMILFNE